MTLEKLVLKYIASAEQALKDTKITESCVTIDVKGTTEVLQLAKAYLEDAKYYRDKNKLEVSLTSIAYCEGLLDTLKMLGVVTFKWPEKRKRKK